jgi:hypothetical protein
LGLLIRFQDTRQLDVLDRLAVCAPPGGGQCGDSPIGVANRPDHGVEMTLDANAQAANRHRDRVHEERAVVSYDLDHGTVDLVTAGVERRPEDAQRGLALPALVDE